MTPEMARDVPEPYDEAVLAHQLAHSLVGMMSTVRGMRKILTSGDVSMGAGTLRRLTRLVDGLEGEVEGQLFQALTVLQRLLPEYLAGLIRPRYVIGSPFALLLETIPRYKEMAAKREIEFELPEEGVGDAFPSVEYEANMVRRTFHNVLTNAIKYSYGGSKSPHRFVKVWHQRHDSAAMLWVIRIQNYGVGIEEGELARVFEPGYRSEGARNEGTFGTGLGLWDARECMVAHGGDVSIKSKRIHGETYVTTVSLVFPRTTNIRRHFEDAVDSVGR